MNGFEMGRSSALEAIDQKASYNGLIDALDSYYENLGDQLAERSATGEVADAAMNGFLAVLKEQGIEHRPHGCPRN